MNCKDKLKKAQQINLCLLKKMDEICCKYKIVYYLDSGALIGAIRHKNFIPWDDDVDVVFTRKNYEKLLKVPKSEWGEEFRLVPYYELADDSFLDYTTRLVFMGDKILLNTYDKINNKVKEEYRNRVCMDCFVLDYAYDNWCKRKWQNLQLITLFGLAMGHRGILHFQDYRMINRLAIMILSKVGSKLPLQQIMIRYDNISKKCRKSKFYYYSNYPIPLLSMICSKSWFESRIKVPIGDEFFWAPKDYDKILNVQYGDYMKLPDREEQKPQHLKR